MQYFKRLQPETGNTYIEVDRVIIKALEMQYELTAASHHLGKFFYLTGRDTERFVDRYKKRYRDKPNFVDEPKDTDVVELYPRCKPSKEPKTMTLTRKDAVSRTAIGLAQEMDFDDMMAFIIGVLSSQLNDNPEALREEYERLNGHPLTLKD